MAISVEKKVGFFFICCMIILGVMLEVGEKWNPFEKAAPYRTYLSSVTGLKEGDPVRLAGVDVGRIKGITVLNDRVQIDFEVKKGTRIKSDTIAGLRLTNLLGGQFLGLSLGSPNAPLLPEGGGGDRKGLCQYRHHRRQRERPHQGCQGVDKPAERQPERGDAQDLQHA